MSQKEGGSKTWSLVGLGVVLGVAGTLFFASGKNAENSAEKSQDGSKMQSAEKNQVQGALGDARKAPSLAPGVGVDHIADLVEKVSGSVVNVRATSKPGPRSAGGGGDEEGLCAELGENNPLCDLLKKFSERGNARPRGGLGSGFIIESDGLILTNAHVVEGADEIIVRFADKKELKAKIMGVDKKTDIAVLKVDAKDLPAVKVSSSEHSRVGEWVVAIGSPYGFEASVTAGILSAKGRALPDSSLVSFLQSDAAVNPGNSGGPLFNLSGEVIGINSQIFSRTGGFQGISFAIPIELAIDIKDKLKKDGKVTRGRIGVSLQEVTKELAEEFGLEKAQGALIGSTAPDGAAAKGGMKTGDVILSVDGKEIKDPISLPPLIASKAPGQKISVEVWRKGKKEKLEITVAKMEEEEGPGPKSQKSQSGKKEIAPGIFARPLTGEESSQKKGAALIERVEGDAGDSGISVGDVIMGVGSESVASWEELEKSLAKAAKGRGRAALLIRRGDADIFRIINMTPPKDAQKEEKGAKEEGKKR